MGHGLQYVAHLFLHRAFALEWVQRIDDVTPLVKRLDALRREGRFDQAERLLPVERRYPA
jgi:hypothetical protein